MRQVWRSLVRLGSDVRTSTEGLDEVNRLRARYRSLDDDALAAAHRRATTPGDVAAITAVVAWRVLGLEMHDGQIEAALALARGRIVEMPTGDGKTLAAVPAIVWNARRGHGVHVMTVNDYLARRDAAWMGGIYERLGLSVAAVQQAMTPDERRAAYCADITYATANEIGFDYLRDGLAPNVDDRVHRVHRVYQGLAAAVIDEADSILIDEARTPLVIAGGSAEHDDLPFIADGVVRHLRPGSDFTCEPAGRLVLLTPAGVARVERTTGCLNLFDAANLAMHTAVQDALHAHALLQKDVDYVVHRGAVLSVDEFKGRIIRDRRWPAGLQTAIECKEGVRPRAQGRVLGSITVENLVSLYHDVCGMTGTAATQAREFRDIYGLDVEVIPPNRPIIRVDRPDRVFETKAGKEQAIVDEIRCIHGTGQPVLVGTESIEASERLSRALEDVPHALLNARHEEEEAAIVALAGVRGAVTISTNMAGRGVDIALGPDVAALGGLHVIGASRHESRRIDHQLRGRAGRQGDPGSSEFFVSREDALMVKYAGGDAGIEPDQIQRISEGQNLDIRLLLRKYESVIESQRRMVALKRQAALAGDGLTTETERRITLHVIDELWADYLAAVAELRSGAMWVAQSYADPHGYYLKQVHAMFGELERAIVAEVAQRLADPEAAEALVPRERSATWTYITTDDPFGPMSLRIIRRLLSIAGYRNVRDSG
ncbi:MAG: accessory Sec system translocase SecA2 [Acidobacteriota bacterium]